MGSQESFPEELMLALRSGVGSRGGSGGVREKEWETLRQRAGVGGSGAFEELEIQCPSKENKWMKNKGGGRWTAQSRQGQCSWGDHWITDFD